MAIWEAVLDRGLAAGDNESRAVVRVYAATEEEARAKVLAFARGRLSFETSGYTDDGIPPAAVLDVWKVGDTEGGYEVGDPPQPYTVDRAIEMLTTISQRCGGWLTLRMVDHVAVISFAALPGQNQVIVSDQ
jgi:hypothetical protein